MLSLDLDPGLVFKFFLMVLKHHMLHHSDNWALSVCMGPSILTVSRTEPDLLWLYNGVANALSSEQVHPGEWCQHPEVVVQIWQVNLFANAKSTHCSSLG